MDKRTLNKQLVGDSIMLNKLTKNWTRFLAIVGSSVVLSSCSAVLQPPVVDPKDVTISQAMKDIGMGFSELSAELGGRKLGVFVCKVTMAFNIKASGNQEGKLVLDLPKIGGIGASVNVEHKSGSDAERGNVINIEMYNPGCLPTNTLGFDKPDKVEAASSGMSGVGTTMAIPTPKHPK